MITSVATPPRSRSSSESSTPLSASSPSLASRRHSPGLSLQLKDLPGLSQPSPPSNTLIIINLDDPVIFTPANLASIRQAIDSECPLYSFSPLKSFRRIICAFHDISSAIEIRSKLDGESVLGNRIRVYFGQETKIIEPEDQHLKAPKSQRLFFISPPPSPPCGWEMRNEDPPNKDVHADDLAAALHRLSAKPADPNAERFESRDALGKLDTQNRQRSDSRTIVFSPVEQGHGAHLPAIAVEDTSYEGLLSPVSPTFGEEEEGERQGPILHTARPPVELMHE